MAEASDQQGSIQGSSLWRIKCRKERSPSINWEVGKEGSSSVASITKPPTSCVNNAVVRRGGILWS